MTPVTQRTDIIPLWEAPNLLRDTDWLPENDVIETTETNIPASQLLKFAFNFESSTQNPSFQSSLNSTNGFTTSSEGFSVQTKENALVAPAQTEQADDFSYGFADPMFSTIYSQSLLLSTQNATQPSSSASDLLQSNRGRKRRSPPHSSTEPEDDEEEFKRRHNAWERKRQASINDYITQIKKIIFPFAPVDQKMTKRTILQKAVDYLIEQQSETERLRKENAALRFEIESFKLNTSNTTSPSSSSTSANSSLDDDYSFQQQDPSARTSKMRQAVILLTVLVFFIPACTFSRIQLEVDGEFFATRALQAFKIPELANEYIDVLSIHAMASAILSFCGMFIRLIVLFTFASFIKQMCEPVIYDDDPKALLFQKHVSEAESCYSHGNAAQVEFHIKEAAKMLGPWRGLSSSSVLAVLQVVFELLRNVSHRVMIGTWIDQLVLYLRGTKQNSFDVARFMFVQTQRDIVGRPPSCNKNLIIAYQLLVILNNAEVAGPSGNSLYALTCISVAWHLRFSPSNMNVHSKYVFSHVLKYISICFRQLAWYTSANADADSHSSMGRIYTHAGLEFFAQGRLKDAVFSLSQAMDIHRQCKTQGSLRAAGFCLVCVFFYQERYEKVLHLLGFLEENAQRSPDRRFEHATLFFQTLIMLKTSTNKADAHRALAVVTERHNPMAVLSNLALAFCRFHCGDIVGTWEIVKRGVILEVGSIAFFELLALEGYCELAISLLDCKINNISASAQLPSRQEIEQQVTTTLATMKMFSSLYPVCKPTLYIRNAMYFNIIGQQKQARSQLQQAQKSAHEMKLQVQLKHASRMLEQLENDMNLQKNCSSLSIQV